MSSPDLKHPARKRRRTPTRQLVPRAEREQQMLEVAARLFSERGFNGVSMEEIAEEVGITKPMLYAYFDSKDGLYRACIERAADPLLRALEEAIDPDVPPERQLWAGLVAVFGFINERRDQWSTFFVEASTRGGSAATQITRSRQQVVETLGQLLRRAAVDAGVAPELSTEIEVQAHALLGATEAVARWALGHPEAGPELLALRVMNFAWMGFGDLLGGQMWLPPGPTS
jgi:AcrR family transcriptional regulator